MEDSNETLNGNYEADIAEKISTARRDAEKTLLKESYVYRNQIDMIKSIFDEQAKSSLSQTTKLLINLGIGIHSGKESAIDWGITRALNHGATEEMIKEVIEIVGLNSGALGISSVRTAHNVLRLRKIRRPKS